ncbi:hypothetical protein [Nitrospira sp. Nam80]
MDSIISSTLQLYRDAGRATIRSLVRGWIIIVALIVFALAFTVAASLARPLGIAGGFLLGAVNALLIGAVLSLTEQAVMGARSLGLRDVTDSFGHYFWDVISVGFILWIPTMVLDMSLQSNPDSRMLVAAILLLVFILLNPAPEVIYQVRHDSPLDVLKSSYEFVLENWIEWFLPLALVLMPLGFSLFVSLSNRLGRGAGLDFFQLLILPFTVLTAWLNSMGMAGEVTSMAALLLTPPLAAAMLLFRGHLFAALRGTSRRQRAFASKWSGHGG